MMTPPPIEYGPKPQRDHQYEMGQEALDNLWMQDITAYGKPLSHKVTAATAWYHKGIQMMDARLEDEALDGRRSTNIRVSNG